MNYIIFGLGLLISMIIGFLLGRKSVKKEIIQVVVRDDLTPLKDFRINSRGESVTKTITRTIIQFVKYKDEYQVYLIMQGHEFTLGPWHLVTDKLPLMIIKESELGDTMKKFMLYDHIIEVVEK